MDHFDLCQLTRSCDAITKSQRTTGIETAYRSEPTAAVPFLQHYDGMQLGQANI